MTTSNIPIYIFKFDLPWIFLTISPLSTAPRVLTCTSFKIIPIYLASNIANLRKFHIIIFTLLQTFLNWSLTSDKKNPYHFTFTETNRDLTYPENSYHSTLLQLPIFLNWGLNLHKELTFYLFAITAEANQGLIIPLPFTMMASNIP